MKRFYIILIVIGISILAGTGYVLYILNRPVADTARVKADASLSVEEFSREFADNMQAATEKYTAGNYRDTYIALSGKLEKIEKDARGVPSLFFLSHDVETQLSLQEDQKEAAAALKPGDMVKVKGKFNTAGEDEFGDAAISVKLNLGILVKE